MVLDQGAGGQSNPSKLHLDDGVSVHCFSRFGALAETRTSAKGRIASRFHETRMIFSEVTCLSVRRARR
jgi:hypothetical protein